MVSNNAGRLPSTRLPELASGNVGEIPTVPPSTSPSDTSDGHRIPSGSGSTPGSPSGRALYGIGAASDASARSCGGSSPPPGSTHPGAARAMAAIALLVLGWLSCGCTLVAFDHPPRDVMNPQVNPFVKPWPAPRVNPTTADRRPWYR